MASSTIDVGLTREFSATVHHDAQQTLSRTRGHIIVKAMSADDFAYDGLGLVEAVQLTSRNQKIEFQDIEHLRRKIGRNIYTVALPIDSSDVAGMKQSQMQEYSKTIVQAMNRQVDRIVAEAAFASVLTGRDFENTVTFAADGGLTVDASAGLTYSKLLEIGQKFTDNEVGNDMNENFHLYLSGKEETSLFGETELTSGDFSRQYAIDKGSMTFAGKFGLTFFGANANNPILNETAGGLRECIAMSSRAICLGISQDIQLEIQERNDLHRTKQVVAHIEMGAVRTEGSLIQKVQTTV